MRYKIGELQIFATPKAETIFQIEGFPSVTFEFSGLVNTILFIHCGLVQASQQGGEDYFEIVGRLYSTYHPNQNEEKHEGKLYVYVYGHPNSTRFETLVEHFEWYPDGSFDVITPDGQRHKVNPPQNTRVSENPNSPHAIMKQLEEFRKRYIDPDGIELLVGGLDSYISPDKIAAIAAKYDFVKHKSFGIDDGAMLQEVQRYLQNNRMVAVAAWEKEKRVDIYLEP